jgi:hypothetical protein
MGQSEKSVCNWQVGFALKNGHRQTGSLVRFVPGTEVGSFSL